MRIWLALIVAPLLALADQTVALTLVGPGCAAQTTSMLHASHAVFLTLAVVATAAAWRRWLQTAPALVTKGDNNVQRHFIAGIATIVGAMSAVAIAAMWLPTWLISPCIA
jgi:hypothetical protein